MDFGTWKVEHAGFILPQSLSFLGIRSHFSQLLLFRNIGHILSDIR